MLSAGSPTLRLTRQCTCVVETESDSDNDCDISSTSQFSAQCTVSSSIPSLATPPKTDISNDANPKSSVSPSIWTESISLAELAKDAHDPFKASLALHNAEALRQATALDNVFCRCYDIDTVLTTVQKRESDQLSPVQMLLLEPDSIKQIFSYATSIDGALCDAGDRIEPSSGRYRQAYVATEIILGFYLKAIIWYGEPKRDQFEAEQDDPAPTDVEAERLVYQASPTKLSTMIAFRSNATTRKMARRQRMDTSMRWESSGSSHLAFNSLENDHDQSDLATRGYLLRLEDLTADEWKYIFRGLFECLWRNPKIDGQQDGDNIYADDEVEIDGILVANMCRITKDFVTFPAVHRLICHENRHEKEGLLSRLAAHAYSPDIASLLHGLLHLCIRREIDIFPIIRCIVEQIVDQVPTRLARSLSSVSSTSTVSSTSSTSPRSSLNGSSIASPSALFSLKAAPPSLFLTPHGTTSTARARITGCAEILTKILKGEYPNTFRYFAHAKVRVASFEKVKAYESEFFSPKLIHSNLEMHYKLKCAVLAALTENLTVLSRLAELGMAELRLFDAHHVHKACIPQVLVIDVLRHALVFSRYDPELHQAFVAPIELVVGTICTSINYHQHLSTISEFAARDCFSDSESDIDNSETSADFDSLNDRKSPRKSLERAPLLGQSTFIMEPTSFAFSYLPTSGKAAMYHRPLSFTLLVVHVVKLLNAVILMASDRVDSHLTRSDLATSLMAIFEKFPSASILHCQLVKLYVNLLNRPATNGRVNNPLLRSVFRCPNSLLEFILRKLDTSSANPPYAAHLAIIGVEIAKICSSPSLQQEFIRQCCDKVKGWNDFAASLIATHYQQMNALDQSVLGLQGETHNGKLRRRTLDDDVDTKFVLARPSASTSEHLPRELEPSRRRYLEPEGSGSIQNLHRSAMLRSRSQSKFPPSFLDSLQSDESTSFDLDENGFFVTGYAYQKRSEWVKVHLKFEQSTCHLTLQDVTILASGSVGNDAQIANFSSLKQFLTTTTQTWTSRPKTLVVCNARKWITFGRNEKRPDRGAFGFQVEVFDGYREEYEMLTFVTCSNATRMKWFNTMQSAITRARTSPCGFSQDDEAANTALVECVAKNHGSPYSVIPDVKRLSPVTSASFFLKSEVPEEMPFWGTYYGDQGIIKYATLLKECVHVVFVKEKSIHAVGDSVFVEFDATFQRVERYVNADDVEPSTVTCACTDTYLLSGSEITALMRTIADSEKLVEILCDE